MKAHVPNALTGLRLLLAVVFFLMLSFYQYEGRGSPVLLTVAFAIYVVALITDYLDGHLARKWNVEGAFGRIVDPFVDKILVLGSFAFFAGKNFIIADHEAAGPGFVARTITGVVPTVFVIMLARELLVTAIRGAAESSGMKFGAEMAGKVKMVVQSTTILVILAYVNYLPDMVRYDERHGTSVLAYATYVRDACIWATVAITVLSSVGYIRRAIVMYRPGGM